MPKSKAQTKAKEAVTKAEGDAVLDSVFERMSFEHCIPANEIATVLRQTAFKTEEGKADASPAEMKALLSVAEKYKLNPFTREIYAFRNKNGVLIPIVSIDGWVKIMNNHPQHNGFKFNYSENMIKIGKSKECFEWMEIIIYRKDREYPIPIREYLDECYNGNKTNKSGLYFASPWDTHTKRMIRHKTLSQGIRIAYGVNELYDFDEAERIDEAIEQKQKRDMELEKPETAVDINTISEPVEPIPEAETEQPKVLNEISKEEQTEQIGIETAGKRLAKVVENITVQPSEKKDTQQQSIFKDSEQEKEKEKIPDIF